MLCKKTWEYFCKFIELLTRQFQYCALQNTIQMFQNSEKDPSPVGFVSPTSPPSVEKDQNTFNPAAFSYNIPLDNANSNKPVSN